MEQDIIAAATRRHTVKAYDATKKIPADKVEKIKQLLQLSPSSVNSQPWHFILASTEAGKEKVAKSAAGPFVFNKNSMLAASHVVVFCAKTTLNDDDLQHLLDVEEESGRFAGDPETFKSQMHGGRSMFVNLHKNELNDEQSWLAHQVYLNLGSFLLGVSALGLDATPMEGFDIAIMDKEFGLTEKGMTSLVVVPIGFLDSKADYNADLPKSRLPIKEIINEI